MIRWRGLSRFDLACLSLMAATLAACLASAYGYAKGYEAASRRWPLQRSAYATPQAYHEAQRQMREGR